MYQENRRSFVKKSLATSMTFTFSGLIRAHGEEGGETTTSAPEETTIETTDSGGTTTWNPEDTTVSTPDPDETTVPPTTAESTVQSTDQIYYLYPYADGASAAGYSQKPVAVPGSTYTVKLKFWNGSESTDATQVEFMAEAYDTAGHLLTTLKHQWISQKGGPPADHHDPGYPKLITPPANPPTHSNPAGYQLIYTDPTDNKATRVTLAMAATTNINFEALDIEALLTIEKYTYPTGYAKVASGSVKGSAMINVG